MKKRIIFLLSALMLVAAGMLTIQSCTKDFEEINTDPFRPQNIPVGEEFKQVLQNIYAYTPAWITQLQQNLIADVYSGYMMPPTPFRGNSNNMTYDLVDGWNEWPWNVAYGSVMSPLRRMEQNAGTNFPEFNAWAKICRVTAMHRVSDIYGPIIYSNYGILTEGGGVAYDSQQDAYHHFFDDLDAAVTALTPLKDDANAKANFAKFDLVYGGDITKWIQFANSLRLRLAVRISKVDAAEAKIQAEKALSHPVGVITDNSGNCLVTAADGSTHPLNVMDNAWNDIRMGAPMESILTGFNDPRGLKYFEPSTIVPGTLKGIRQGIAIAAKDDYIGFSALVDPDKVQLMVAAEVYFLRAEAALRGWAGAGGTAQSLYEQGVQTSFDQYGLGSAASYLASNSSAAAYVDPVNGTNNAGPASNVSPKWDDAGSADNKLEQIITQKWLAMYPDGQEAWSEYRRTGYPRLYPVLVNNSAGKIDSQAGIKRINMPAPEYRTNREEVLKAVQTLGGADTGGTPLWWDVD
ncbi:MAG: SusD/RagB family nutrient-binding outer membrane lipoprotein [Saprospiraceae bacterium]|nr:SusD/RagB family nutrient-binding outer membrane lipoprotein [Saprospiraceae bacterium]